MGSTLHLRLRCNGNRWWGTHFSFCPRCIGKRVSAVGIAPWIFLLRQSWVGWRCIGSLHIGRYWCWPFRRIPTSRRSPSDFRWQLCLPSWRMPVVYVRGRSHNLLPLLRAWVWRVFARSRFYIRSGGNNSTIANSCAYVLRYLRPGGWRRPCYTTVVCRDIWRWQPLPVRYRVICICLICRWWSLRTNCWTIPCILPSRWLFDECVRFRGRGPMHCLRRPLRCRIAGYCLSKCRRMRFGNRRPTYNYLPARWQRDGCWTGSDVRRRYP